MFPTFGGRTLPAFLALPEGTPPDRGWPVVVWVHGGPAAQTLPNWRPDLQTILSLGIAVLLPNVRGSIGYGRASAALDDREKRMDSVRDLAPAHAWLSADHRIDAKRIGTMGQSYGGWIVLAAVGIDFYGIARWKTFFGGTGPWRVHDRASEYGDPCPRCWAAGEPFAPAQGRPHRLPHVRCARPYRPARATA